MTPVSTVPGVVDSLEVVALSAYLLRISWEPPLSPNGVLTGYQVEVVNLIDSSESIYYVSPDIRQHNISNRIGKNDCMYNSLFVCGITSSFRYTVYKSLSIQLCLG